MPRVVYPLEYRQRLVELARKRRSPEERGGCRRPCSAARRRSRYDNAMCESFFATLECELIDYHASYVPGLGEAGALLLAESDEAGPC